MVMMVMMVSLLEVFWTIVVHSPFFTDAACFRVEIPIFRWWNPNSEMVKSPFWMVIYVYISLSIYLSKSCFICVLHFSGDLFFHFRHPRVARPSWRSSSATRSEPGARPWTWTDPWTSNARSSSRRARIAEMWRWIWHVCYGRCISSGNLT